MKFKTRAAMLTRRTGVRHVLFSTALFRKWIRSFVHTRFKDLEIKKFSSFQCLSSLSKSNGAKNEQREHFWIDHENYQDILNSFNFELCNRKWHFDREISATFLIQSSFETKVFIFYLENSTILIFREFTNDIIEWFTEFLSRNQIS